MLINNIFHVTFLFKTYKYILTLINGNVKIILKNLLKKLAIIKASADELTSHVKQDIITNPDKYGL